MRFKQLKPLEQKEIREVLSVFGLIKKEQDVYLAMLPLGKTTLTPVSEQTGFPVTTVQSVIKRLVGVGLIDITKRKTRSVYEAHDPSVLKKILERKTQDVIGIVPLLKQMKTEETVTPKIRVYFRERVTDIFNQALASKEKMVYEIVSAKDFQETIGEKFHFTRKRIKGGINLKSLRVESEEIKKYNKDTHEAELREAKFLPREMTFQSSIMFWDNTVAFFSTKDEGIAWIVESASIKDMIEQMFEMMWSVSRRMETLEE
jgi:sugar-specific transcriptional regulator TrmB